MPAANSIADQVSSPKCGLEWSGPSRMFPARFTATTITNTSTAALIRKYHGPNQVEIHPTATPIVPDALAELTSVQMPTASTITAEIQKTGRLTFDLAGGVFGEAEGVGGVFSLCVFISFPFIRERTFRELPTKTGTVPSRPVPAGPGGGRYDRSTR